MPEADPNPPAVLAYATPRDPRDASLWIKRPNPAGAVLALLAGLAVGALAAPMGYLSLSILAELARGNVPTRDWPGDLGMLCVCSLTTLICLYIAVRWCRSTRSMFAGTPRANTRHR